MITKIYKNLFGHPQPASPVSLGPIALPMEGKV